jgi:hypothetical protein
MPIAATQKQKNIATHKNRDRRIGAVNVWRGDGLMLFLSLRAVLSSKF